MDERDTLLWQLGMTHSLFQIVASGMTDEEALRPPAAGAWSVRLYEGGRWRADRGDEESDPAPPTTAAWLLWHMGWWWSDVTGRAFGDGGVQPDEVPWPGSVVAAIARVEDCHARWKTGLEKASADDFASTSLGDRCWPLRGLPFSRVVAWVNGELMKNTAELGATRRFLGAV